MQNWESSSAVVGLRGHSHKQPSGDLEERALSKNHTTTVQALIFQS